MHQVVETFKDVNSRGVIENTLTLGGQCCLKIRNLLQCHSNKMWLGQNKFCCWHNPRKGKKLHKKVKSFFEAQLKLLGTVPLGQILITFHKDDYPVQQSRNTKRITWIKLWWSLIIAIRMHSSSSPSWGYPQTYTPTLFYYMPREAVNWIDQPSRVIMTRLYVLV